MGSTLDVEGSVVPTGGRLQPVLMRHSPPAICQNLEGGGGGLGGGSWGGGGGGGWRVVGGGVGWRVGGGGGSAGGFVGGGGGQLEGMLGGGGFSRGGSQGGGARAQPTTTTCIPLGGDVCLGRVWGSCWWLL